MDSKNKEFFIRSLVKMMLNIFRIIRQDSNSMAYIDWTFSCKIYTSFVENSTFQCITAFIQVAVFLYPLTHDLNIILAALKSFETITPINCSVLSLFPWMKTFREPFYAMMLCEVVLLCTSRWFISIVWLAAFHVHFLSSKNSTHFIKKTPNTISALFNY